MAKCRKKATKGGKKPVKGLNRTKALNKAKRAKLAK